MQDRENLCFGVILGVIPEGRAGVCLGSQHKRFNKGTGDTWNTPPSSVVKFQRGYCFEICQTVYGEVTR